MYFNYEDVQKYGSNCVRITGVEEHGARMAFTIDEKTKDEIYNKFAGSNPYEESTVNVFADGSIILITNNYNWDEEEWEEEEDLEFLGRGKQIIVDAIENCLAKYPVANRQGMRLTTIRDIKNYLKNL